MKRATQDRSSLMMYALASAALLAACGGNDGSSGSGSLRVQVSGEQAARDGYPVGSGDDEIAFADGWTLTFDKVLVSFSDFTLQTSDGADAELDGEPVVADLHLGEPELWRFDDVPAQRWDRVGYRYAPPTAKSRNANAVEPSDLERMEEEGYSLYIEATAAKDSEEVMLQYGFPFTVRHTRCVSGIDETEGLVVSDGAANQAQITVHLDHLFFDSYATDAAALRFDPMAAMAPESGPLTLSALARQDNLSDLVDAGMQPLDLAYDPGSAFTPVPRNLEQYVIAAGTTTGHWNGEGHCAYDVE
jgi:hypothetical protein